MSNIYKLKIASRNLLDTAARWTNCCSIATTIHSLPGLSPLTTVSRLLITENSFCYTVQLAVAASYENWCALEDSAVEGERGQRCYILLFTLYLLLFT